jgi:hypothetical protein
MTKAQKALSSKLEQSNAVVTRAFLLASRSLDKLRVKISNRAQSVVQSDERGDVPGWVLVVLMTTGLVTAIWTIAAPRLSSILRNSLDAMNAIR